MNIIIVGGGTAGWITALMAAKRHPDHSVTLIESSKIGIIGVGESTTGTLTDMLFNLTYDYGCNLNDFILETGATLKYGIRHKGWTSDIDQSYFAPIDGSWTNNSSPDPLFNWAYSTLDHAKLPTASKCGFLTLNNLSNFNKFTNSFADARPALHVDAQKVGKYFQKICLGNKNAKHIDSEISKVNLNSTSGNIESVLLSNGDTVIGDIFIDCSGFHKVLIKELDPTWKSFGDKLPLNSAIPFWSQYDQGETPGPFTTAWAQKNGWMWQVPLMDRMGNGYVFSDAFTTAEKAQEEIETILGKPITVNKVIKFDPGRLDKMWIKNCVAVGLSAAFLEPLEATAIHSAIVQAKTFIFEYLKPTAEDTLNSGSRNIYNKRMGLLFDDLKEFIIMHYMGGRKDSEFWKYINSGVTNTDFVNNILEMSKSKMPSIHEFPTYPGGAGWALYSYILAGLGIAQKHVADGELNLNLVDHGPLRPVTAQTYYDLQDEWRREGQSYYSYNEFINYFRKLRYENGTSNIKY